MLRPLLVLSRLVQGASTNTVDSSCPPPDGTTRSVWSILGSCALTLLICIWHTIHFDIRNAVRLDILVQTRLPVYRWNKLWFTTWWFKGLCILGSFVAPEATVAWAAKDWQNARKWVVYFREEGYEWSMTHSFFAEMDGFEYRDDKGDSRAIDAREFLWLCGDNKIANPAITAKEIKAMSKSDALGKTILALQLFWFMLQVAVRGSTGFAVTLIELDTVCMAVLSLLVLCLWWDKPLRPDCPLIFYSPREVKLDPPTASALSVAWKPDPTCLSLVLGYFICTWKPTIDHEEKADTTDKQPNCKFGRLVDNEEIVLTISLSSTWMILGGLHLIAWNFDFPTETEKILWRVSSLFLTGGSLAFLCFMFFIGIPRRLSGKVRSTTAKVLFTLGVASRTLLVGLMLASLRALPCSAYYTVSWTTYIPHL